MESERSRLQAGLPGPRNPFDGMAVGRIVHFVLANGEHRAALVVRVDAFSRVYNQPRIELSIFLASHDHYRQPLNAFPEPSAIEDPRYDPEGKLCHSWHWPEHV